MNKIAKFLKRLSKKDRDIVQQILEQLYASDMSRLNIRKLKGENNLFRVRRGNIRIVYTLDASDIVVLKIEFRSEGTYK